MLKIGLTGGIGSGKTTVSNIFAELDQKKNLVSIIDTDILARKIVEIDKPAYSEIVKTFGYAILNPDLSINRTALRKLIFADPIAKKKLESITHPAIQTEVAHVISSLTSVYCIIVIPLLFETKSNYNLDRILVIDSSRTNQIERTIQRDHILAEDVELIIESQIPCEYRLQHANDVIINKGDLNELIPQVKKLHQLYIKLEKEHK